MDWNQIEGNWKQFSGKVFEPTELTQAMPQVGMSILGPAAQLYDGEARWDAIARLKQ